MNIATVISIIVGFIVYLLVGRCALRGVQIREGGEAVLYLFPAGAAGVAVGFLLFLAIKMFQ